MKTALVTGAGGFIGHHLAKYLSGRGYRVIGADIKAPLYEPTPADRFETTDLRLMENCTRATEGVDHVYHLAAEMGGIGFISGNHASIARSNVLIDSNMLEASCQNGVERFFYASSACIYPDYRQQSADPIPLKESDAYPAKPEGGYGLEKLFAENLCSYYASEKGMVTRVARFHNVFGPLGAYEGGREKAPAAICRKVAAAGDGGEVEIWGDGLQTRSFLYVDDCVEGIHRLMNLAQDEGPINLGSTKVVSINALVDLVCDIAGKALIKRHLTTEAQGVRGRNSDNSLLRRALNWEPETSLETGLLATYKWISDQLVLSSGGVPWPNDQLQAAPI